MRNPKRKQFELLDNTVYLSSDEILEQFVELDRDLQMKNDAYTSNYINLATVKTYITSNIYFWLMPKK